jgi:undecaprenyl-diphosphatase
VTTIESIIIGVVEGLTEFLPISSTAHIRITGNLLKIPNKDEFFKLFTVAIQLGAILSVVVLYFKKFLAFKNWQFYAKLMIAVIPALIFGKLFSEKIDLILETPLIIAAIMIAGGVLFLFIEKIFKDVANNLWLCPECNRPFMELVPQYKIGKRNNVSL